MSFLRLEPIKTALCMGNFALARKERTDLLRLIIDDLVDQENWQLGNPPRRICELVEQIDAIDIPEEA